MLYQLVYTKTAFGLPVTGKLHTSLREAEAEAKTLNAEGTGWEFDLITEEGNVLEHYLGL